MNVDAPVQKSQPQSDKKIKYHKDRTTGKYVPDEPLPPSVPVNGPARYCGSIKWIDPKAVELSEQYHTNDREYLSLSRIRACVDIGEGNSTCVVLATPETWKPRDPLIMSIKSGERIYIGYGDEKPRPSALQLRARRTFRRAPFSNNRACIPRETVEAWG